MPQLRGNGPTLGLNTYSYPTQLTIIHGVEIIFLVPYDIIDVLNDGTLHILVHGLIIYVALIRIQWRNNVQGVCFKGKFSFLQI
jgi:hypothetical protein